MFLILSDLYDFRGTNDNKELASIPKQCQLAADIPQDVQVGHTYLYRLILCRGLSINVLTLDRCKCISSHMSSLVIPFIYIYNAGTWRVFGD